MLYVVATPIGNLSDVSERVLKTLKEADFILCEDTRVTGKLCHKFSIETPLISYHHHSGEKKQAEIMKKLRKGKDLALVTDAGTPGIADPAGKLIKLIKDSGMTIEISSIPGPSAITAAASVSGFYMNKFTFLGFPPKKRKRKKFFEELLSYDHPVIIYESPHRIIKTLKEIADLKNGQAVVFRELTKMHEKNYRGKLKEIIADLEGEKHTKGEFTVIIKNE